MVNIKEMIKFWNNGAKNGNVQGHGLESNSPSYFIDTTKMFKIWFSKDPEEFLNEENKNRLIIARFYNPEVKITFIHGDLSKNAKKEMIDFCKRHNIQPLYLNDVIRNKNPGEKGYDPQENIFNDLIRDELASWKAGTGGNAAAASDMLRVKKEVLEKYGAYSDFDVLFRFPKNVGRRYEISAPIAYHEKSNDIVIASVQENGKITQEAARDLNFLRDDIIYNYTIAPQEAKKGLPKLLSLPDENMSEEEKAASKEECKKIKENFNRCCNNDSDDFNTYLFGWHWTKSYIEKTDNPTIHGLRHDINESAGKIINNNDTSKASYEMDNLKKSVTRVMINSVISNTGPCIFLRLEAERSKAKNLGDREINYKISRQSNPFLGGNEQSTQSDISWIESKNKERKESIETQMIKAAQKIRKVGGDYIKRKALVADKGPHR
ncbi:MAG: glycosyltransferase family 88 protein [Rickettsiaceae bacterium]|nr:glycosyltransferase family 88 protein [Rickettsiaceae bacterium]